MCSCRRILTGAVRLLRAEDGPTATEYAILLGLLILGGIGLIASIGGQMQVIYDRINEEIPS